MGRYFAVSVLHTLKDYHVFIHVNSGCAIIRYVWTEQNFNSGNLHNPSYITHLYLLGTFYKNCKFSKATNISNKTRSSNFYMKKVAKQNVKWHV